MSSAAGSASETDRTGTDGSAMYLRALRIKNFRSCYDSELHLDPALTLLVGENNSGKSNVVDALRLATAPPRGRRTRYFEVADLARGCGGDVIDLSTELAGANATQRALNIPALDLAGERIVYGLRFKVEPSGRPHGRPELYCGPCYGPDPEREAREQVRHVYLAPLRNAQRELDSPDGGRLASIIQMLFDEGARSSFLSFANDALRTIADQPLMTDTRAAIQDHVDALTQPVRGQAVGVGLAEHELRRLTRSFRIKMAEHGLEPADLAESGLGYANLLYIATVILELRSAREAELTIFLVEEPEAHLHPQLQMVLLDYLREQAEQSVGDDPNAPAGRIQVVATTHSPNLASSVPIESIVVLRSVPVPIGPNDGVGGDAGVDVAPRSTTVSIPIAELGLKKGAARKIDQYLDATKVALLFARRVVLVEGLAEAVMLPVLARRCVLAGDADAEERRAFRAVTIIPVGSVDFEPYVRLLLTPVKGWSVADRLVVITDADPELDGAGAEHLSDSTVTNRRTRLEAIAKECGDPTRLNVFEATYTLEADLLLNRPNLGVVGDAFLKQHPRSQKVWEEISGADSPAEEFYRRLKTSRRFLSKGEFAHDVAAAITVGAEFQCPDYLADAIRAALAQRG